MSFASCTWQPVVGYEGLYEVSAIGQVKSLDRTVKGRWGKMTLRGKVMKLQVNKYGYLCVGLRDGKKQKLCTVHRLVAKAFLMGDDSLTVNHIDGNKTNNSVYNLEWVTAKENSSHAAANGMYEHCKGEKNINSKLDKYDALFIKNSKRTYKKLSSMFNVSEVTIANLKKGRTWKHI